MTLLVRGGSVHDDRQREKDNEKYGGYRQIEICPAGTAKRKPRGDNHPGECNDDRSINGGGKLITGHRVVVRTVLVGPFLILP